MPISGSLLPRLRLAEDLHHFDTASWRLLTTAIGDEVLRQSVLFILTYRCHRAHGMAACRPQGEGAGQPA